MNAALQHLVAFATPSAGAPVLPSVSALGAAMPTALAADGAGVDIVGRAMVMRSA